ncbi:MAG: citrate synthase, partial [Bacteroidetes bacterium]|nr:citrate synthase [Bacteroidota bacterium]
MATSNHPISTNGKSKPTQSSGLEGVVALETKICDIDGQKGELIYAGYDIQDLAAHATFEEVAFLLWNGRLPSSEETEVLIRKFAAERTLPPMIVDILRMTPEDANPMAALRTGISVLSLFDGEADDSSPEANY